MGIKVIPNIFRFLIFAATGQNVAVADPHSFLSWTNRCTYVPEEANYFSALYYLPN